jgi:hypothetical protein
MFALNKAGRFFILVCLLSAHFNISANTPDPLWEKAILNHQQAKKWAAKDVLQVMTATKDGETKTKTITKQLDVWEGDKAKYKVISIEPPTTNATAKKPLDLSEMTESTENEFFTINTKVIRTDNLVVDKQACVKFEMENSVGKFAAWVDAKTGKIIQKQVEMNVPMAMEGVVLTKYAEQAGVSLPQTVTTLFEVKIPFKKGKIEMKETYTNWVKHE